MHKRFNQCFLTFTIHISVYIIAYEIRFEQIFFKIYLFFTFTRCAIDGIVAP